MTPFELLSPDELLRIRVNIRQKLDSGALPYDHIPRFWGGPANHEMCIACEREVVKGTLLIEGIGEFDKVFRFHVPCFYVWDAERRE